MRRIIRGLDVVIRRLKGVYEFSAETNCLLRLRLTSASHELRLPDVEIPAGSSVLELHLWNERVPPMPEKGPDLAWALKVQRMSIASFQAVAAHIRNDRQLANVKAIGGPTAMLTPGDPSGGESLMRRLGFVIFPYVNPLGRFGEFWENLYTWMLIWTFNAPSARHRQVLRMRRSEIWMSVEEFLRRYGPSHQPHVLIRA